MRTARTMTVSVLAAFAIALTACGGGGDEAPSPEPEPAADTPAAPPGDRDSGAVSGQAVFAANCATCHGEDGAGGGPAAVGLEPPPADLNDATWTTGDGSLAAIRNTIENGSPGTAMIAWKGTLTDAEITAVAEYVHSMGGGQ